jgi:hypothetical protein|tara:strand:+ start:878 stop:1117 length:240 start_codon:yes stop_codon:yes gene_type:complete
MSDYLTWSNGFYLLGLILAGVATLMSAKYRIVMKEVGDVVKTLEQANKDNKVTKAEKEKIMKEMLDVLKAVISLKWKIF